SFDGPRSSFSILWGTIGGGDALTFYGTNGDVLGTIYGSDLEPAAVANWPAYQWVNGVNITVQLAATPISSVSVIGSPSLTFEYANVVASVPGPVHLAIERDGSGGFFIRFTGVPGVSYRLQHATSLTGPWTTSTPQTASASGQLEFHDLFPSPGQGFY